MIKVDDTLEIVDRAGRGHTLTPAECEQIHRTIVGLNNLVIGFERVTAEDAKAMKHATLFFKRANAWPAQMMPSLKELLEWALDRAHIKTYFQQKEILEGIAQKLDDLGELSFRKDYEIPGAWLLDLRTRVYNALTIGKPIIGETNETPGKAG